ncbi:MAG: PIN domain-containing protein [Chloroflexota bacterium]
MAVDGLTFVDTNILIYAHDRSDRAKQGVAQAILERLWADRTGTISTQVLQEMYVVATSQQKLAMSPQQARDLVGTYSAWPTVVVEPALILTASRLAEEHHLSFWDALIVEAARVAGAATLLTEDLQHGRMFGGVRVEDPFMDGPPGRT